jgi:phenylalanyl-tRNA synthetase beta chain
LAGGELSALTDEGQTEFAPFEIQFDLARANRLMGHPFSREEITALLNSLEIEVLDGTDHNLLLKVPPYRVDVQRPQDIMEEILRIFGYNNVDRGAKEAFSMDLEGRANPIALREKYFDSLAANGWSEIVTNPLVPAKLNKPGMVELVNRLSEDHAVMRDEMLHTGLEVVEHNHRHNNFDLRLFEFGKTYAAGEEGKYTEKTWISFYLTGLAQPPHWKVKESPAGFYTLAREMARLQQWFGFEGQMREMAPTDPSWDYGAELVKGETVIARYGAVSAAKLKGRDIKGEVYFAQIDWEAVFKLWKKHKVKYTPLPKFPAVRRDISMIVPETTRFATLADMIRSCNPKLIREVDITDVYRGKNIEEGKTSYLINLTLLDETQTLIDKTVDKLMEKIFRKLEEEAGVSIRK